MHKCAFVNAPPWTSFDPKALFSGNLSWSLYVEVITHCFHFTSSFLAFFFFFLCSTCHHPTDSMVQTCICFYYVSPPQVLSTWFPAVSPAPSTESNSQQLSTKPFWVMSNGHSRQSEPKSWSWAANSVLFFRHSEWPWTMALKVRYVNR